MLKTVIQFKTVELKIKLRMPKMTLGMLQVEIQEMKNALKTASPNPVIAMKNIARLQPKMRIQKLNKAKWVNPNQILHTKKMAWL